MYSILQLMMAVLNWNISLNKKKIMCVFIYNLYIKIYTVRARFDLRILKN